MWEGTNYTKGGDTRGGKVGAILEAGYYEEVDFKALFSVVPKEMIQIYRLQAGGQKNTCQSL